jgi:membrane-associated phospholipid phosphatase
MLGTITQLDLLVSKQIILIQNNLLTKVMLFITSIGGTACMVALSVLTFSFLAYKKRWRHALLFSLSMLGALALELLLKILVHRQRPGNALIQASGYSFPSGHATMALVFFPLLIYLFKDNIRKELWKHVLIISCIVIALLIGFSRIYLNVHWLSDVIGGFALGLFWLMLMILLFKMKNAEKPASEQAKTL